MTNEKNEHAELCSLLREFCDDLGIEAASTIEQQAAEIERLSARSAHNDDIAKAAMDAASAEIDRLKSALSDEPQVSVAQAVAFAEYVESHAKGAMVEAAKRFLSVPFADEIRDRLAENKKLRARIAELEAVDMAHRLAVMLECAILDRGRAWDEACALLDEYKRSVSIAAADCERLAKDGES